MAANIRHNRKGNGVRNGGVVVVVLLVLVYLLIVPSKLSDSFRSSAQPAQKNVAASMNKVYATFALGAFSQDRTGSLPEDAQLAAYTTAIDQDKADLAQAKQAVSDAEATVNTESKRLEHFAPLPLLDLNKQYHSAAAAGKEEKDYLKQARDYLASYKQLIDYGEKSSELQRQFETGIFALGSGGTDVQSVATTLDAIVQKIDQAVAEMQKLTPPEDVKEANQANIREGQALAQDMRDLAAAVRALDVGKLGQLSTKISAEQQTNKAENAAVIKKLQTESSLHKSIESLQKLEQMIDRDLGKG